MELKVSIFDVLSYLLPGLVYFLSIALIGDFFINENLILKLVNSSNSMIILIFVFSYILGHALQPLHKLNFFKYFFKSHKNHEKIIQPLIDKIDPSIISIIEEGKCSKRAILEHILQIHNEKLAYSASRFLALALFVRNLSFSFLLLAIVTPLTHQYFSTTIICLLIFLFLLMSISLLHRYERFAYNATRIVTEGIIALNLKNFDFIKGEYKHP
jgi:hypothetical protein